jgi:hypothetical protein
LRSLVRLSAPARLWSVLCGVWEEPEVCQPVEKGDAVRAGVRWLVSLFSIG